MGAGESRPLGSAPVAASASAERPGFAATDHSHSWLAGRPCSAAASTRNAGVQSAEQSPDCLGNRKDRGAPISAMDKLISFPVPRAFRSYPALLREAPTAGDEGEAMVPETSFIEDPLLCKVPMPLRAVFYPLGFAFEIITNSQAVLDAANEGWGHSKQRDSSSALQ